MRLFTTEKLSFAEDWGYVATFAGLFSIIGLLFKFQKKIFYIFGLIIGVYLSAMGLKVFAGMILPEREIVHTFLLATLLYGSFMFLSYPICFVNNKYIQGIGKFCLAFVYILILTLPVAIIAYFVANHAIFSSDILLTLFQTNTSEVIAYLSDQNKVLWALGGVVVFFVFGVAFYQLKNICCFNGKRWSVFFALFIVLFYAYAHVLSKINVNFVYHIFYSTYQTLSNFKEYQNTQKLRLQKIEKLKDLNFEAKNSGVFVLVIGESETKDHMSTYGYQLKTTPYLDQLKDEKNVIIFENAYANHTHTIPTLTYALSSADQYHENDLSKTYSVLEIAKAAGFETYWISNQPNESVFLTPLSVMSSVADHQVWLNSNIGDKILETYHDAQVIDELNNIQSQKAFIVVHLMGSHGAYKDRYPLPFNRFKKNKKAYINAYDNSVLYTDFVLHGIYEKAKKLPNFMSLIYFSDHGDDPDNKLGHESSRFTYTMARIPFVIAFSDQFIKQNNALFETLKEHQNSIWTNDLFYNLLLSLFGVDNFNQDKAFDLSDPSYSLTKQNALTLHGTKNLKDE